MAEKKRKALDLQTKHKIILECEKQNSNKSEISRRYGIQHSTLFTILKNKEKVKAAVLNNCTGKSKKLRGADHPDLEAVLFDWFMQQRAMHIPVSGPMIKAKADDLALRLKIENFRSSEGWLQRFKARRGITLKTISGESASVDDATIDSWQPVLKSILNRYSPCDVYNADESGLFYNLLPDKTLAIKGDPCKGGKRSKERLTVLLCCNMDGSDKLKPLIIGKSENPRAFRGVRELPCSYKANKKAWMTSAFFIQWLNAFDAKMGVKNRKVVLFIDNCPAHPIVSLRNVELVFFPPNCTSRLQPLDQGIFRQLKHKFRSMLVNALMRKLATGSSSIKWNVLDAMRAVSVSWQNISTKSINNCFKHAGFAYDNEQCHSETETLQEPEGWNEIVSKLNVECGYEDYVAADDNITVTEELNDAELLELRNSSVLLR